MRISPVRADFDADLETSGNAATIRIRGDLTETNARVFERELQRALAEGATTVTVDASQLSSITPAGVRAMIFVRQRLNLDETADIILENASDSVRETVFAVDSDGGSFQIR